MAEKFRNKYRIASTRLQNWDYGWNAPYFVTICTINREWFFGDIVVTRQCPVSTMHLSEIGNLAEKYWNEIPVHFPFVELGEFIVMPNHVHGIIIIDKPGGGRDSTDAINRVSTIEHVSTNIPGGITGNNNPMLSDNLSRIIRWYKGRVSFESRKIDTNFAWQSRFHEHIIMDDRSFHNISTYIKNNPLNWKEDKFHAT